MKDLEKLYEAANIHASIGALEDCQNKQESYGEICVRCNKCGRFDEEGSSSEEPSREEKK